MYTLKKVALLQNKISMVHEGYERTLPNLLLVKSHENTRKSIGSIQEIEEGWEVLVCSLTEYLKTSAVQKIVSSEPDKVVFETQTSIYELVGGEK